MEFQFIRFSSSIPDPPYKMREERKQCVADVDKEYRLPSATTLDDCFDTCKERNAVHVMYFRKGTFGCTGELCMCLCIMGACNEENVNPMLNLYSKV